MPVFREEQRYPRWVYLLAAAAFFGALFAEAVETLSSGGGGPYEWIPGALAGTLGILVINLLFMVTEVTRTELVVTMGRFFPLYRRRVALADILEVRAVTYRPLRDAGGWGIRWGRFEGSRCAFLNARGDRGVFLELRNGKRLIIGSQNAGALAEAVSREAGLSAQV